MEESMTARETLNLSNWLEDFGISDSNILKCIRFVASADAQYLVNANGAEEETEPEEG